jgi:hypothetical protein
MAKLRVGFGSDFNITGQKVGLGTANPTALLEVAETAKADFNITGVTTLTSYGGFVAQNQNITEPTTIKRTISKSGTLDSVNERETGFTELGGVHHGDDQYFNTLSEDLVVEDGKIFSIHNTEMVGSTTIGEQDPHTHASHVSAGSLEQVSVTGHFSVPCGGINERQETLIEGTVRFNDDLNTLEFFNGNEWRQFTYNQGQSGRAVFSGGESGGSNTQIQAIDYYNIHTTGNALNFGNATITESRKAGCASATRGLSGGSDDTSNDSTIDYVTIASTGDAIDFGDLYNGRGTSASMSSSTRGLWAAGRSPTNQDTIDYVEIATLGNALDFGDTTVARQWLAGCSSSTRGIIAGGESPSFASPTRTSRIEYITMASKGDAILFGELTGITGNPGGCSNSTRGFFGGGEPSAQSKIDMITIASTGNAIRFGELTVARLTVNGAGSQTRGTFLGGHYNLNVIDYITMSTEGDAIDFGDLTIGRWSGASLSDSHGGLGGF